MKSHSQARAALAGDYHLASAEGKRCQFYIHDWPWPSSDLMVWWYDDVVCPVSCGCGCGCLVRRFITLCSLTNQIASQCHCLSVYLLRYLVLDIQISSSRYTDIKQVKSEQIAMSIFNPHSTHRAAPAPCGPDTFNLYSVKNGRRPQISQLKFG